MSSTLKAFPAIIGRSLRRLVAGYSLTMAAAIAYYVLLSLFPLLFLAFAVVGFVLEHEQVDAMLRTWTERYFPAWRDFIWENWHAVLHRRAALGAIGIAGLMWLALGLFTAIEAGINMAWRAPSPRGFFASRLAALIMVMALLLLLLASVAISALFELALRLPVIGERFLAPYFGWLGVVSRPVTSFVATAMGLALVYRFVPVARVSIGDVWLGSLVAASAWEASRRGFVWYVIRVANYEEVYGSLGAAVALLIWAYISALVLLWGAELCSEHAKARRLSQY